MERLKAHLWWGGRQTAKKSINEDPVEFLFWERRCGNSPAFLHALTCIVHQHVAIVFMFHYFPPVRQEDM